MQSTDTLRRRRAERQPQTRRQFVEQATPAHATPPGLSRTRPLPETPAAEVVKSQLTERLLETTPHAEQVSSKPRVLAVTVRERASDEALTATEREEREEQEDDELFHEEDEEDPEGVAARREAYGGRLELAHVVREFGQEYLERARGQALHPDTLAQQERVLRALLACRTSAMGEHRWRCPECEASYLTFNSCCDRHCPKCGEQQRRLWAEKLALDLLPVTYHHVIPTLPHELTCFVMAHGEVLYSQVMQAAGQAVLQLGQEELEAQLAAQLVLHTWGQIGNPHVHLHLMVPGGGIPRDASRGDWVAFPEERKFLSLERLAQLFRDGLLKALRAAYAEDQLQRRGTWRVLESPQAFEAFLEPFEAISWIVRHRSVWVPHSQPEEERYLHIIRYLARYANRVMIANSRLLGLEGHKVLLRYKDYRDGNQWKTEKVPGVEFLQHVLPRGLHNKRRYGFWGYRVRTRNLERIRQQWDVTPRVQPQPEEEQKEQQRTRRCTRCEHELEQVSQTPRPSIPVMLDLVWEDLQRALDVYPQSCPVRTHSQLLVQPYLDRIHRCREATQRAREQEQQERERSQATAIDHGWTGRDQHAARRQHPTRQHPHRGPPPDRQRRLDLDLARCELPPP